MPHDAIQVLRSLGVFAGLLLIVGCGPQKHAKSPDDERQQTDETNDAELPATDPQVFRMAISGPPITFDPGLVTDNRSSQIVLNTFEGLMVFDKESGPIKKGMATDYTVSDDGRHYEFTLREDAKWSDGEPVTAHDFVAAWKRVLYPSTASRYAWLLADVARIKGARAYNTGRSLGDEFGARAVDDRTLVVELEQPVPFFLDLLTVNWMKPAEWISNGPYVFGKDSSARKVVLEPNPHYWNAAAQKLARIEVAVIEDDEERIAAFDAGELDWTGPQSLPLSEIQSLASRSEFRQETYLAVEYIVFNTQKAPLDDPRVRQAIALAIDADTLVTERLQGVGDAAYGFVPPMPGFSTKVRRQADPDRARALLAEAGHEGGEGLPKLTYLYPANNSNARKVAEHLQQVLQDTLGIELELEPRPLDGILKAVRTGEFELTRSAWVADFSDPVSFLGLWTSESPQNKAGWKNAAYDELLEEAAMAEDRGERYRTFEEAELLLHEEQPVTPLYYKSHTYLLNPRVEGFAPHKLNIHLMRYVSKSTEEAQRAAK